MGLHPLFGKDGGYSPPNPPPLLLTPVHTSVVSVSDHWVRYL